MLDVTNEPTEPAYREIIFLISTLSIKENPSLVLVQPRKIRPA